MTDAQTATLVLALVAPILALLGPSGPQSGRLGPSGPRPGSAPFRWPQAGTVVAAGAWLALVVSGAEGHVGGLRTVGFHVTPLVAAAGCGAALLAVASLEGMTRRRSQVATCLALSAVGMGLTGGAGNAQPLAVVGGLALAVVLTTLATAHAPGRGGRVAAGALAGLVPGAAGVAACVVGFVVLHERTGRWTLPDTATLSAGTVVAFVVGAALLGVYATLGPSPRPTGTHWSPAPGALLLAGGLTVGLSAAPLRAGATDLGIAVVILAAAAVVAAGLRQGGLSLTLLALSAAAGPAALAPGARLLGAAAVIAVAVGGPWVWLAAVPGAVSLATGVVDDGGRLALAVALGAGVVAVLLAEVAGATTTRSTPATGEDDDGCLAPPGTPFGHIGRTRSGHLPGYPPRPGALPAALAGAWLLAMPGSWTWTGAALDAYDLGMGRALAAGLLVVVGYALAGELSRQSGAGRRRPPRSGWPPGGRPRRLPAQLVRLARSASPSRPRRATRSQRARPRVGRSSARPPKEAKRARPHRPRPPKRETGPERPPH